ncbi:CPBP family intramembrane glutamic endopeptidase [[Eubacterium] cellulosolvens]
MSQKIDYVFRRSVNLAFVSLTSLIILTYFISLVLGLVLFFFTDEGFEVSKSILDGIPASFLIFFNFYIPAEISLGHFFLALITFYITCFALAWNLRVKFHHEVKNLIKKPIEITLNNFLLIMPVISSMLLIIVVAVQSIQEIQGIETGFIEFSDSFMALYELAYSPILEEISYRITPLGLVVLIGVFAKIKSEGRLPSITTSIFCFLFPDKAKEKAGLDTIQNKSFIKGISFSEWVTLILICSLFGLNHYLAGGGWGIGKITSAFVAGFAFGLIYLKYGFFAPILLHWFFNFYTYSYELAAETYNGLLDHFLNMVIFLIIIIGSYGWLILVVRFFSEFSDRNVGSPNIKRRRYIFFTYLIALVFSISNQINKSLSFLRSFFIERC